MGRLASAPNAFPRCVPTGPVNEKGKSTSLETPWIVSVPCATYASPFFSTDLLLKVSSGNLVVSRKLGLRRSLSRLLLSVLMLVVLMTTSTEDLDGSLSSKSIEPLKSLNRPCTVLTANCLTANPPFECTGSILYSSAGVAHADPQTATTTGMKPKTLRIRMRSSLLKSDGYLDGEDPHRLQEIVDGLRA